MIGRTISHYRIDERRGAGGMGVVYRAFDLFLQRDVALKFLPPGLAEDEEARRRFLAEARAAAALNHENLCGVHEIGEAPEGSLFIVMDWCEGESLREILARAGALPPRDAAAICLQCARALAAAHARGIVHRDVKPANLMVGPDGRVRVVDFGLARLADAAAASRTGGAAGTLAYMAPEQVRGAPPDRAGDVWALGATLYECLSGRRAFPGETERSAALAVLRAEPRSLPSIRQELPERLCALVERALARNPAARLPSMEAFALELETAVRELDAGLARPARRRLPRGALRLAAAGLAGSVVLAAGAALLPAGLAALRGQAGGGAVAVAPFVAPADREGDVALAGLLRESLAAALASAGRLRVLEPEPAVDEAAAAELAGARWLLSGSVVGDSGRLRVTARLVELRGREHVWAETFDRPAAELRAVQEEIALAVVRAVGGALDRGSAQWLSTAAAEKDPRVEELLAKSYGQSRRSDRAAVRSAWTLAEDAAALSRSAEPHGAAGYAAFARLSFLAADLSPAFWGLVERRAEEAAAFDPYWLDAAGLPGLVALYARRDAEAARGALDRAVALPLGGSIYPTQRAWAALLAGRPEEASRRAAEAVAANPVDWLAMSDRVRVEVAAGALAEAERHLGELLAFEPRMPEPKYATGVLRLAQGRFAEARAAFLEADAAAGGLTLARAMAALAASRGGDPAAAVAARADFEAARAAWVAAAPSSAEAEDARALAEGGGPPYVPVYVFALLELAEGDPGSALASLAESARLGEAQALRARFDPGWEALRGLPEFGAALAPAATAVGGQGGRSAIRR